MNPQEAKLLAEMFEQVQILRSQQVQLLAESRRAHEWQRHMRQRADTAWRQYNALYEQLTLADKTAGSVR